MPEDPKGNINIFGATEQVRESDSSLDKIEAEFHGQTFEEEGGKYDQEADAYERENEEPYQAGPQRVDVPVEEETEAEDGEEEELDEYDAILQRVRRRSAQPVEEEEEDPHLQARLAYQQGRLEALEEQIRQRTAERPAEPEPEAKPRPRGSGIDYRDPAIRAALQEAISDPEKLGPTIAILARKEAEALVANEVGEVKENLAKIREQEEQTQQRQQASAGITAGLQAAYSMGGLEAAIVKEAWQNQQDSMLFQYLANGNANLATTPQGIMTAVLAVARAVERADANSASEPGREAPAPVSSKKRSTKASSRGRNLRQPKKADPEMDEKSRIVGAKTYRSAIPFLK